MNENHFTKKSGAVSIRFYEKSRILQSELNSFEL